MWSIEQCKNNTYSTIQVNTNTGTIKPGRSISILQNKICIEAKEYEGKYRLINSRPELRTGANTVDGKWKEGGNRSITKSNAKPKPICCAHYSGKHIMHWRYL